MTTKETLINDLSDLHSVILNNDYKQFVILSNKLVNSRKEIVTDLPVVSVVISIFLKDLDKILLNIINQKIKSPNLKLKDYLNSKIEGKKFFNHLIEIQRIVENAEVRIIKKPNEPKAFNINIIKKLILLLLFLIIIFTSIKTIVYYISKNDQSDEQILKIKELDNLIVHYVYSPKIIKDGYFLISIENNPLLDSIKNVKFNLISTNINLVFKDHIINYLPDRSTLSEIPFTIFNTSSNVFPCILRMIVSDKIIDHSFYLTFSFLKHPYIYWIILIFPLISFIIIKLIINMKVFRRPKCRKFFTYKTNTLDIRGLSAGLSQSDLAQFDIKLGKFKISPEFVKVSDRLMYLDMQQYQLCESISNITDKEKRDELFIELVKIRLEMLSIAKNPGLLSEMKSENGIKKEGGNIIIQDDRLASLEETNKHEGLNKLDYSDFSVREKRLEYLKVRIEEEYSLLKEWQNKRNVSNFPDEIHRCINEIDRLKNSIKQNEDEYNKLSNFLST